MAHSYKQSRQNARSIDRNKQLFLEQQKSSPRQTVLSAILSIGAVLAIVLGFTFISAVARTNSTQTASGNPSATITSGYGSLNYPKGWCGNAGQAACPPIDPGWFSALADTPAAIASTIARSNVFNSMRDQYRYTSLDVPALVHAMFAHTGISYYDNDHWVVSVLNTSGQRCGIFDFIYDRVNHRMAFSSYGVITPTDPHAKLAFPYTSSATASSLLRRQRNLAIMPNSQAELVFFPINPSFRNLNSPTHLWSGGGDSPMNPIWLLKGANGQDYFVGVDQRVYVQTDLPIAQGRP